MHTELLNLNESVNKAEASFPLRYDAASFPDPGFSLNQSQINAVNMSMQARGICAIKGSYATGKTSLIPLIIHGLLSAEAAIKDEKRRQLQSDVARTYTIEEMLAQEDDSDEDMYDYTASSREQATELTQ